MASGRQPTARRIGPGRLGALGRREPLGSAYRCRIGSAPGWFGNEPDRQEWWRILLAAALAFLLIETVVANRSTP